MKLLPYGCAPLPSLHLLKLPKRSYDKAENMKKAITDNRRFLNNALQKSHPPGEQKQ